MTTAMVSMKPVVSHWARSAPTLKSAMIEGSATDRIVSLRIITIAETTRAPISRPVCLEVWVG